MKILNIITRNLDKAKFQLRMSEGTLMRHNKVVAFEDTLLTIQVDHSNKKYVVNNQVIATQFTEEAANKIVSEVSNGSGERPVVMSVLDYYKKQITQLEKLIESLSA